MSRENLPCAMLVEHLDQESLWVGKDLKSLKEQFRKERIEWDVMVGDELEELRVKEGLAGQALSSA